MQARIGVMAGAILLALGAAPSGASEPAPQGRVILAVYAHPDDELFVAPALAAEARRGAKVSIVYTTRGDAGPGFSGLAKGAELAQVRSGEAACASAALGLSEPQLLDFGDGTLPAYARGPGAAGRDLKAALADAIAAARPDVVITWGPDGGYGHADHRMVSAVVTQVIQAQPARARPQLLYPGIRAGTAPADMRGWAVSAPDLLDRTVAYSPADLERTRAAMQCHKTQFDAAARAEFATVFDKTIWQGGVHFRTALPGSSRRRR